MAGWLGAPDPQDQVAQRNGSAVDGRWRERAALVVLAGPATGAVRATRTNAAASRIGAIRSVAPPRGSTVYRTAGDGTPGTLDLVTLVQGVHNAMVSTQVLPGLSASTRHTWRRGHGYTVKVTDAGAPVAGAAVHFAGRTAHTNRHGIAHVHVVSHQGLGHARVGVSRSGYAGVRLRVTVTR